MESTIQKALGTKSELALVLVMVGILLVLFTPVPPLLLDFLFILNFSIGLLILLLTFYTDKPLAFSTFPSILLIATLFRLSLNIASTRLILDGGYAGEVINAIGDYVVGGNYIIGLVVFAILIVVQFVVVTSGAQRVAEVAARFTLDSMPGKQMSIDADLNMGLIDEVEAKERRQNIEKEANFYGAMDGASKFVKGDAVAGIIVVLINIVGGLTVGLAQRGLSWSEALHTYTLLTVGDGIVTQIPALVISTATGIIVTRAATDAMFGEEIAKQVANYPKSLVVVGLALLGMLLMPGVPVGPVLIIVIMVFVGAYFAFRTSASGIDTIEDTEPERDKSDDDLYREIKVEPIEIYIGEDLLPLIGQEGGEFMEKIKSFRKQFAQELGFVFPHVKIKESYSLSTSKYVVNLFGSRVADGELFPNALLAISAGAKGELEGIKTKDPTYGLDATWINENQRSRAKELGYTLVDPLTVLITHFCEVIRNHAHELLTRSEIERLLERVRSEQPAMVEELIPNLLSIGNVQSVLQLLLSEKVSIRNIELVLETLIEQSKTTKQLEDLVERVRGGLSRTICDSLLDDADQLQVITLDPSLEQSLINGLRHQETSSTLVVDPRVTEMLVKDLAAVSERMMSKNLRPVLLVSPTLRRHIKKLLSRLLSQLYVLSLNEIPSSTNVVSFHIVRSVRDERSMQMKLPKGE